MRFDVRAITAVAALLLLTVAVAGCGRVSIPGLTSFTNAKDVTIQEMTYEYAKAPGGVEQTRVTLKGLNSNVNVDALKAGAQIGIDAARAAAGLAGKAAGVP